MDTVNSCGVPLPSHSWPDDVKEEQKVRKKSGRVCPSDACTCPVQDLGRPGWLAPPMNSGLQMEQRRLRWAQTWRPNSLNITVETSGVIRNHPFRIRSRLTAIFTLNRLYLACLRVGGATGPAFGLRSSPHSPVISRRLVHPQLNHVTGALHLLTRQYNKKKKKKYWKLTRFLALPIGEFRHAPCDARISYRRVRTQFMKASHITAKRRLGPAVFHGSTADRFSRAPQTRSIVTMSGNQGQFKPVQVPQSQVIPG